MNWAHVIAYILFPIGLATPYVLVWAIIHDLKLKDKENEDK